MASISRETTKGVTICRVWFCDSVSEEYCDADITYYYGCKEKYKDNGMVQHTTYINLNDDIENLFAKIKKNVRYEINRCKKETVSSQIILSSDECIMDELPKFENKYNTMYEEKNLIHVSILIRLKHILIIKYLFFQKHLLVEKSYAIMHMLQME